MKHLPHLRDLRIQILKAAEHTGIYAGSGYGLTWEEACLMRKEGLLEYDFTRPHGSWFVLSDKGRTELARIREQGDDKFLDMLQKRLFQF